MCSCKLSRLCSIFGSSSSCNLEHASISDCLVVWKLLPMNTPRFGLPVDLFWIIHCKPRLHRMIRQLSLHSTITSEYVSSRSRCEWLVLPTTPRVLTGGGGLWSRSVMRRLPWVYPWLRLCPALSSSTFGQSLVALECVHSPSHYILLSEIYLRVWIGVD